MAKPALARITGVAIAPGVSRNNRLYTSQNIGRLVERANTRINSGDSPLTMRTHHGAGDDSTRIVGRVTRIWQDDTGAARYEGEIADAGHGLPESWPNKPLHEYTEAEFSKYAFPQLESYVLNGRVPRA